MEFTKWDKRFMSLANEVGNWTSCIRRAVGAVAVKDKRVLATGYNGASAGIKSCKEKNECLRNKLNIASGTRQEICYAVHAEQNVISQAAKFGISLEGATLYITHSPCTICTKIIINSGIKKVVYGNDYPDDFSIELLKEAGVEYIKYEE